MFETENPDGTNPQGNETAGSDASASTGYDSFLGHVPDVAESVGDEPDASTEEAVAEQEPETETEPAETETQEEEQPEVASVDAQLEALTPNERAKYAARYPTAWKAVNDPNQPADIRQILLDKINSDIEIQKLRSTSASEPTQAKTEEPKPETQQQPIDPAKQREQYAAFVDDVVKSSIDPQVAAELGKGVLGAMGLDLSNPDDPEVKPYIENAPKLGMTLAKGATDLVMSVLQNPQVMDRVIEAKYPGFSEMYETTIYAQEWERTRFTTDKDGNQPFKDLPAYGTREFKEAMTKAAEQIPNFDSLKFEDANGKPLSLRETAQRQYALLAKFAAGQRVSPAAVKQALETGKKQATQAEQRRAAGRVLGTGQGNKQFAPADDESPMARGARIARERDSSVF